MNTSETETTIEGIIISPKGVRTKNDSFPAAHIESVHVIDGFRAWLPFVYVLFWLVMCFRWIDHRFPEKRFFGWAVLVGTVIYLLYLIIVRPTTCAVAITVGGRRHILAQFKATEYRPDSVTAAKSKANSLADAIRCLL